MFTVEFSPKTERQISRLEESSKQAIKVYLKEKVMPAKNKKGLYEIGETCCL